MQDKYSLRPHIFTDGSKTPNGATTAAIYVKWKKTVTTWRIPAECSVATAELLAIYQAVLLYKRENLTNGVIFTDSKSALQIIANSSNWGDNYLGALIAQNINTKTTLQWVPSHLGIKGNEIADRATHLAHSAAEIESLPIPYADFKREALRKISMKWEAELKNLTKGTHIGRITPGPTYDIWKSEKRAIDVAYTRLRIGHTRLGSHMHRLKLQESPDCETCLKPETIEHFLLECNKYVTPRARMLLELRHLNLHPSQVTLEMLLTEGEEDQDKRKKIRDSVFKYLINSKALHRI